MLYGIFVGNNGSLPYKSMQISLNIWVNCNDLTDKRNHLQMATWPLIQVAGSGPAKEKMSGLNSG